MKKNLYYQTVFQRSHFFRDVFTDFMLAISSWPRIVLEVFTRKNFGERYFSFSRTIKIAVILALLPYWKVSSELMAVSWAGGDFNTSLFLKIYLTWYIYIVLFILASIKRLNEVKHLPSVYDFKRFSLSSGEINSHFFNFKLFGKEPSIRTVETIIEPGFFVAMGLILSFLGQPIGTLILWCAIIYALSYMAAYRKGDHFVMDKIDEMICNEEMVESFVNDKKPEDTRGFKMMGGKPDDPELRRKVVTRFFEDEETARAQ